MDDVPLEVIEILSRLPVKSLLRCMSVSKAWCALIDSRYFVNLHLNQFKKSTKILTVLYGPLPLVPLYSEYSCYSLYFDSGPSVTKMKTPFDIINSFDEVVGSCNGLICLSRGLDQVETILWNPSTRKYKMIPDPIYCPHRFADTFMTDCFGYDHLNDDYKVVRLFSRYKKTLFHSQVIVYSLKLNMCQSVEQDFRYNLRTPHGQSADGVIHWIATDTDPDRSYIIVGFDLASQTLELVPIPEYFKNYRPIALGILGGRLCAIGHDENFHVDIWIMEEHGVKESWRKLVSLTDSDLMDEGAPTSVKPIVYLENGKVLLLELACTWFLVYDLEKKESKHWRICRNWFTTYFYNQSLV